MKRNLFQGSRTAALVTALAVAGGVVVATAPAAVAAERNGSCESGELCLYYNSNLAGPVFDLYYSDSDFRGNNFPRTTIPANNNTASYRNRDAISWDVYTGVSRTGSRGYLPPGHSGNFSSIYKNTVSSAYWR